MFCWRFAIAPELISVALLLVLLVLMVVVCDGLFGWLVD
jgi:hypothetical protein